MEVNQFWECLEFASGVLRHVRRFRHPDRRRNGITAVLLAAKTCADDPVKLKPAFSIDFTLLRAEAQFWQKLCVDVWNRMQVIE
jgi:hypothetical protein